MATVRLVVHEMHNHMYATIVLPGQPEPFGTKRFEVKTEIELRDGEVPEAARETLRQQAIDEAKKCKLKPKDIINLVP